MKNHFQPFPILKTNRCILSVISEKDQKNIFKIYSDPLVMKYMQKMPLRKIEEAMGLISSWSKQLHANKGIRWGIFLQDNPNSLIGTIGLQYWKKSSDSIELGADLLNNFWGKGLAYEFTKPVIDFAFDKLKINRLELRCNPNNIASNKIAKKLGLTFEGTLREYVYVEGRGYDDESVFSVLKEEFLKMK